MRCAKLHIFSKLRFMPRLLLFYSPQTAMRAKPQILSSIMNKITKSESFIHYKR